MNRFLTLSTVVHVGLVAGVLYIGAKNDFSPHKVIESMNFEAFGGEGAGQKAEIQQVDEMPEAVQTATVSESAPTTATTKETVAVKTAAMPEKAMPAKATKSVAKSPVAKMKPAVQTAKQDDSADPEMDEAIVDEAISEVKAAQTPKAEKAEKVEGKKEEVAVQETSTEESQEEIQNNLEAITAAQEQEEQKIANEKSAKEDEHAKKVAYLAQLKKQNAEREAAEKATAESASATAAGSTAGLGSKNEGEGPQPGETVRAVSDFKQMGGNPKPQYSNEDRMANRSGTVTFQAFVNKDGSLNEFQLVESSGHRSLDAKTLQALKKWKFAAGQEGWIEIPFQWDLKGGAQETSTLRNSRSATK